MRRLLIRLVGIAGVLSSVVLPISYTQEGPSPTEAILGRVDAPGYLLTDVTWVAAATVLASAVLLVTAVRDGQSGWQDIGEAWATLAAGGIVLLSSTVVLVTVGYDPAASTSLPGPGLVPTLVGGSIAFGSALRQFYRTVEPRRRDMVAVGGFLLTLASMPFPLYTSGDGRWVAEKDVRTYEIGPGADTEVPSGPPQYTGTELDLLTPLTALFGLLLLFLAARYLLDWETISLRNYEVTTDVLLWATVFGCFGVITVGTREFGQVEWELHGMIVQYSMVTALLAYTVPNVYGGLQDRFGSGAAGGGHGSPSADRTAKPGGRDIAERVRRELPPATPPTSDFVDRMAAVHGVSTTPFVTDAGGVVAMRATGETGGCLLGYHPDRGEWVVVSATDASDPGAIHQLDDAAWSWLDSAYPEFDVRTVEEFDTSGDSPAAGQRGGDVPS